MTKLYKAVFSIAIPIVFLFLPVNLSANSEEVVFWNKMQTSNGSQLISEVGSNLSLTGASWNFRPAMFGDGWDNNTESSYAYANSTDLIEDIREGAIAFWWVPDDDGNTVFASPWGTARKISAFFSNGATNYPQNDKYNFEFWYARHASPASFHVHLYKQAADGAVSYVLMHAGNHPYTGEWSAGDRVHIAFSWHNEPVILGQYIAALWVDGELAYGWAQPDQGTLESWRTTNPAQPFSPVARIGDSIFSYSMDEQLRGPIDNLVFWNYAKSDFSDRFIESPFALPPTADAGPNQSIHAGETVLLDGSGSYDDVTPGESLQYDWKFLTIPDGSLVTLTGADTVSPTFIADLPGTYDISLVVTDEDGLSSEPSQVSISSYNTAPNANAGTNIASYVDDLITLDGSGSYDPDGDPVTYSWLLTGKPSGSHTQLFDVYTAYPTLIPDLLGSYEAELTVNDGLFDSTPDVVSLIIITAEDFAQQQVAESLNTVVDLPQSSVTTSGNQTALSNFLEQAIKQLQKDRIDEAEVKLNMAIERTDGCVLRGTPDTGGGGIGDIRKDYVTSCDDQAVIYPQLINALEALQQ